MFKQQTPQFVTNLLQALCQTLQKPRRSELQTLKAQCSQHAAAASAAALSQRNQPGPDIPEGNPRHICFLQIKFDLYVGCT